MKTPEQIVYGYTPRGYKVQRFPELARSWVSLADGRLVVRVSCDDSSVPYITTYLNTCGPEQLIGRGYVLEDFYQNGTCGRALTTEELYEFIDEVIGEWAGFFEYLVEGFSASHRQCKGKAS